MGLVKSCAGAMARPAPSLSGISLRRPRLHLGGRSSLSPQASAQGWRLRLLLVDEPVA